MDCERGLDMVLTSDDKCIWTKLYNNEDLRGAYNSGWAGGTDDQRVASALSEPRQEMEKSDNDARILEYKRDERRDTEKRERD